MWAILGKIIDAAGIKKLPNLVTLLTSHHDYYLGLK